jgi:hypothetical protein
VTLARDVEYSDVGGEMVILHLSKGLYYSLNGIGARIWALLEQSVMPLEIRDAVTREYQVDDDICTVDLSVFFDELARGELVEVVS